MQLDAEEIQSYKLTSDYFGSSIGVKLLNFISE